MNNSERLIWLSILILGTFFCNDKISKIENLELMVDHQKLSRSIQSDQIIEIRNKLINAEKAEYMRGLEDGKSKAMIAALHGEPFYDYADGYHAALSQVKDFQSENVDKEISKYLDGLINEKVKQKQ
jgi:hypothetical protein